MMNRFLSPNREMVEKNESIRKVNCYNQMHNMYQSLGGYSMAPQGMQQRCQDYPRPINFIQGNYQENNLEDVKTQSMVPHVSSSSNNINIAPLITTTRYGPMLSLGRSSAPPKQTSYHHIDLLSLPLQTDSIENFIQGKDQENNLVDIKTQSMVPYASSSNNNINASLITSTSYGQMLPLALPSAPPEQTGYRNIDLLSLPLRIDSIKKFSFNDGNLQGHTSGFPNLSMKTTFHNQKNLPTHSHGASSLYPNHQRNNSLLFTYLNPPSRVNTNDFHGVKDMVKPSLLPPLQFQNLDLLSCKDLTRERAMKRPLRKFEEIDVMESASKRSMMSSIPPNYYEGARSRMKELLLFKNEKHSISTLKIKTDKKKDIDKDNLDLSLHL